MPKKTPEMKKAAAAGVKLAVEPRPLVVDVYMLIRDNVARGVALGWNRAHKHTDEPGEYAVKDAIEQAVMDCICEYITFPEVER